MAKRNIIHKTGSTATGGLHKNREDRSSGSKDMLADRQTDKLIAIHRSSTEME